MFGRLLDLRDHLLNAWDHVAVMPRRVFLYAALALAIPLPAFALGEGVGESAPAALEVSVSLDRCGLLETEVVCKLDVSYGEVPGAVRYTASVTRADGSVVDYGDVGGGGTSLWVPYVGSGTYSVEIAAYGPPEQAGGRPELLSRDTSFAQGRAPGRVSPSQRTVTPQQAEPSEAPDEGAGEPGAGGEPSGEPPAPECSEELEPPPLDSDGDGVPDAEEPSEEPEPTAADEGAPGAAEPAVSAPEAEVQAEAELPESVDCPGV
jgi:hypothetical protein